MVYNLINGQVMARPYIATIIHIIRPLKSPDFFEILQINPVHAPVIIFTHGKSCSTVYSRILTGT